MELAEELLIYNGEKNTLIYNYFTNKICMVKKELFNVLTQCNSVEWESRITKGDLEKLILRGIIIKDRAMYKEMDFYPHYIKKCKERKCELGAVYLHVTQRCNLNCSYCYNKHNLNKKDELDSLHIYRLIDKLKMMGAKTIILTGGEALLREDIAEICKYIKKVGFRLEILTNGTLLSDRLSILEYIDNMIISLDTFDQNKNQRKGLDIEQVTFTLCNIKEKYRNRINIRSVVNSEDESSWKEVREFCKKNRYGFIASAFIPNNIEEINKVPIHKIASGTSTRTLDKLTGKLCGAGYKEIAIDSDGGIYPCQLFVNNDFKIGNMGDMEDAKELCELIDHSEVTNRFKNRYLGDVTICSDCKFRYLCGGGCPFIPYQLYGDLYRAPEPLCNILKRGIEDNLIKLLKQYE